MGDMYILRGLPGSGKSTLANRLVEVYLAATGRELHGGEDVDNFICEADQYFTQDGVYDFDPALLGEAHAYAQAKCRVLLQRQEPIVVVSNTSTKEWEFEPYADAGREAGYNVFVLIVENRHHGMSVHGVPEEALQRMAERFEISL
jgi:hypothetical protein